MYFDHIYTYSLVHGRCLACECRGRNFMLCVLLVWILDTHQIDYIASYSAHNIKNPQLLLIMRSMLIPEICLVLRDLTLLIYVPHAHKNACNPKNEYPDLSLSGSYYRPMLQHRGTSLRKI